MNRSAGITSNSSRTQRGQAPQRGKSAKGSHYGEGCLPGPLNAGSPHSATDESEALPGGHSAGRDSSEAPAGGDSAGRDSSEAPAGGHCAGSSNPLTAEVFCADQAARHTVSEDALPDGFGGQLSLKDPQSLNLEDAAEVLQRLEALICWAAAQQAQVISRIQNVLEEGLPAGQRDTTLSLSLAAAEVGTLLNVPHMTAMGRIFEAGELCREYPQTLSHLCGGRITYRHAQEILDHTRSIDREGRAQFEAELLALAEDSTVARFRIKARRLREQRHPETIPQRHRDAFGKRRVSFEALPDGMSCVSAILAAEKGVAVFGSLSGAARAAKKAGDERTVDQLRSDMFAAVFLDGFADPSAVPDRPEMEREAPGRSPGCAPHNGRSKEAADGSPHMAAQSRSGQSSDRTVARGRSRRRKLKLKLKTEIMVLIHADTLAGLDDAPAELNGYGPLSPETGRRLFQEATNWTPLVQDPATGEILHIGRRRRVPAGLKRWLQARDGTCRFPGCSVSVSNSEIDHTRPWAWGGETSHGNLEHLCPKHHRLKTLGHWKAAQPEPGVIEWTSPGGLRRRTGPMLDYGSFIQRAGETGQGQEAGSPPFAAGGDPPAPPEFHANGGDPPAPPEFHADGGNPPDPPPF